MVEQRSARRSDRPAIDLSEQTPTVARLPSPRGESIGIPEVRRRRSALAIAMADLESAISRPGPGRTEQWRTEVHHALDEVRDALVRHIIVTESPDSFQEHILKRLPELTPRVRRLRRDHNRAHHLVNEAYIALEAPIDDAFVEEARDRVTEVLLHLSHHRQRGSDLIWEAFNIDIGGEQ